METTLRRSHSDLNQTLAENPARYRFFQAVRLWGLIRRQPGEKRLIPASLRFRSPATLAFPASEILALRERESVVAGGAALSEIDVGFMGLTGPSGALPNHYTEIMVERRVYSRDTAMHDFFDLFTHRSVSLFYAAWRKYRHWVSFEAGETEGLARNIKDISGVGISRLTEQISANGEQVSPLFFVHFAGLLAQKPLSASSMATLLTGYFGVKVEIEQFVGEWIVIPPEARNSLGQQGATLGFDTLAGERVWERQNKMRIVIGALNAAEFAAFLPGATGAEALAMLVCFAVGHALACDVTLILRREDVRPSQMATDQGLRLGFNTWAASLPIERDVDDVRYTLLH
ncbi:MAG: type VI secretion system baseplate subunit TssG [Formivibrio sp.]|nr:type VI secretion system baseplate subunit TssG [Formivibrio sp.]